MKKIIILLIVLAFSISAQAASWDFVTEWGYPTQSEPWQYGYGGQNNISQFIQFTYAGYSSVPWWGPDALGGDNGPVMFRNDTGEVLAGIQPGEVALHTRVDGAAGVGDGNTRLPLEPADYHLFHERT